MTHNNAGVPTAPEYDFQIEITGNECRITKYLGNAPHVVIPETIQGYTVTAIGNSAFETKHPGLYGVIKNAITHTQLRVIKSVVVPKTVLTIGKHAFATCGLEEITLHDGIKRIERYAFEGNEGLKKMDFGCGPCDEGIVYFPKGLQHIGIVAFTYCRGVGDTAVPQTPFKEVYLSKSTKLEKPNILDQLNYPSSVPGTFDFCQVHYY